jgi:hypothetical protein
MAWHPFNLDHRAHKLVLAARGRNRDSLNQAYKMRATCAYGLERFWGEHLRLKKSEPTKADFVRETWLEFIDIMKDSRPDLVIPQVVLSKEDQESVIKAEAEKFWTMTTTDQQECLAVLVALCDAVVWWTQRLKLKSDTRVADDNGETETTEEKTRG